MGMFDNVRCKYPLPVPGANELLFQTKDTPEQYLDTYEISEDGELWREDYDTEDHSEAAKWKAEHPGEELPKELDGLPSMCGCMTRVNKRKVRSDLTGEIRFYTFADKDGKGPEFGWIEFSAYFIKGQLRQLELIEHRLPDHVLT